METFETVLFDATRPPKYRRSQAVLRIALRVVFVLLTGSVAWLFAVLYLVLPIVTTVLVLTRGGGEAFARRDAPKLARTMHWLVALLAYLAFLTDRLPTRAPERLVHFEVRACPPPTVASALLRYITSLPAAVAVAVMSIAGAVVWCVQAVLVLAHEHYPPWMFAFQRGVVRCQVRMLAYHASLTDQYLPFALDTEPLDRVSLSPATVPAQ